MNRKNFMERLAVLLRDLPEEERGEAIQYYEDYFDDAGVENESSLISELGSPEKVAFSIKDGLKKKDDESMEYGETGYNDATIENGNTPVKRETYTHNQSNQEHDRRIKILLIVVLAIICIPVIAPVVFGVLGTLLGIICAIGGILIAAFCLGITGVVVGLVCGVAGAVKLFAMPAVGLMVIGIGLISLAVGAMMTVLVLKFCVWFFPTLFKGIVQLFRKLFHKDQKGGKEA